MITEIIDWYKMLSQKKITLIYSGPLWSEGIGGIAGTLCKRLEYDKIPLNMSMEVFSVFVEQMNNMLMYSEEKEMFTMTDGCSAESPKGIFVLGKEGSKFFIQTGNAMKNENIEMIKSRIDYLNTLDKAALRSYYKQQMHSPAVHPGSKGAGLGFIEIARRISSKIFYSFTPLSGDLSFFTLYVTIGEGADE